MTAVVFFTHNDSTAANPECVRRTRTQLYQRYASGLGRVMGSTTDMSAAAALDGLPVRSVRRVVFMGHGAADGYNFIFHGEQGGVPMDQKFDAGDAALIDALARVMVDDGGVIDFKACFVGRGRALREALRRKWLAEGKNGTLYMTNVYWSLRVQSRPSRRPPCPILGLSEVYHNPMTGTEVGGPGQWSMGRVP